MLTPSKMSHQYPKVIKNQQVAPLWTENLDLITSSLIKNGNSNPNCLLKFATKDLNMEDNVVLVSTHCLNMIYSDSNLVSPTFRVEDQQIVGILLQHVGG